MVGTEEVKATLNAPVNPVPTLTELEQEAEAQGLSYGQMQAKKYLEAQKGEKMEPKKLVFEEVTEEIPAVLTLDGDKNNKPSITIGAFVELLNAPCDIHVWRATGVAEAREEVFSAPFPSAIWKVAEVAGWWVESFGPDGEAAGLDVYVK